MSSSMLETGTHSSPSYLDTMSSFPALPFTILLGIILLYWLFVVLGGLGTAFTQHQDLETGGDSLDAEADLEMDGDGFEFSHESPESVDFIVSDFRDSSVEDWLFHYFSVAGVPLTIGLSFWLLVAWVFSMLGTRYLVMPIVESQPQLLHALLVLFASLILARPLAALLTYPLRPLFACHQVRAGSCLLGKECVVLSARVDGYFGQAVYYNDGPGIILWVRARVPNTLCQGSKAVILNYDRRQRIYDISAVDEGRVGEHPDREFP